MIPRKIKMLLFSILVFTVLVSNNVFGFLQIQQTSKLEQTVLQVAKDPVLKHGEWSCTVIDVESGKPIIELNSDKSLAPASNLKLFTTAAALTELGSDYYFKTTLGLTGKILNGLLDGDLVIIGGADPTLASTLVKGYENLDQILAKFVKAVQESGLKKIKGKIIVDISCFDPITVPDGWLWMDIGNYYVAAPSALCVNDNLYYLYFKPGKKVGDSATVLNSNPENLPKEALPGTIQCLRRFFYAMLSDLKDHFDLFLYLQPQYFTQFHLMTIDTTLSGNKWKNLFIKHL